MKLYDGADGAVDSTIIVIARPVAGVEVEEVRIRPDTLWVTVNGPERSFQATVYPDSLSQAVTWKSLNTDIATVSTSGRVSGRQAGTTRVVATSALDGRAVDTAEVIVSAASKVESVKFDRALLEIYLGGSAEPLVVQVLPSDAVQEVYFRVGDTSIAEILDGKVKGLKEGRTTVTARSRADSTRSTSLEVSVLPKPSDPVDSVTVAPDTLRLYTAGESLASTAAIHPKTLPARFSWRTGSVAVAVVDTAGRVSPVGQGRTFVSAISLADSTRRDSALVIVRKDSPRIQIGNDTTIAVGQTLSYLPVITQDYGQTTLVRWDLDGDGAWDDSSAAPKPVTFRYAEAKEYSTRFSARDTEGNYTRVTRKVRSVNGPVILFSQPADGTYTNQSPITVAWSVDAVPQTSSETLKPGANVITRSATSAGQTFSASITVHYDTVPPARPVVKGPAGPVSTLRPAWTWESAGGGNGTYRFRLNSENLATGATVVTDTAFTPASNLAGGPHTLYVQERDLAGNWSPTGSFTVRIDTTPPVPPVVRVLPASPTNNRRPTWDWIGSASERTSTYRYKLDNNDFRTGATTVSAVEFTPAPDAELLEGPHTLYVQHQDSAGNWSASGSAGVVIDLTAPTVEISTTITETGTAAFTLAGKASDAGSGVAKVTLSSAQATITAGDALIASDGTWTKSRITLAPGANTLDAVGTDKAGNVAMKVSLTVTLDNIPSGIPTSGSVASPTRSRTPTFTWNSGGGIGRYRVRMDFDNFTSGFTEIGVATYTPPAQLPLNDGNHTLYVRETDANGNWSGSLAIDVVVDGTNPTLTVTGGDGTIASTSTTLLFTATDAGTGISGTPTCRSGARTYSVTRNGAAWSCAVTGLTGGANTVNLDAVDRAGNPGSATASITVNVPVPDVSILTPPNNYVTNKNQPIITYRVDNGPDQTYIPPTPLSDGRHEIIIESPPNELGVKGSERITIYVLSNVVFVGPTAKGARDGSSWDDVTSSLYATMTNVGNVGKEIWVETGTYSTASGKWVMVNDLKIFGGFNGSLRPNSSALSNRPGKSKVVGTGFTIYENGNVTVDGFIFSGTFLDVGTTSGKKVIIANSEVVDQTGDFALSAGGEGEKVFDKVDIYGNANTQGTLILGGRGSKLTFSGGKITENTVTNSWGKIVDIQSRAVEFSGGLQVSGNVVTGTSNYYQVWVADQEMSPSLDALVGVTLPLEHIYVYQWEGVIYGCLRYHGTVYGVCPNF